MLSPPLGVTDQHPNQQNQIYQVVSSMIREQQFRLVTHLLAQRRNMTNLQCALYLFNLLIHLIIYFSFQSIGLLNIDWLLKSLALPLLLSVLMGIVLLQTVFYAVYQKDVYLAAQLSIFRFIITPLLLVTILDLSISSLNSYLGYLFFLSIQILSDGASRTFLFQIHRVYSVNVTGSSIVEEMSKFEVILVSLHFVSNQSILHLLSIMLLMVALNTTVRHFYRVESDHVEYKTLNFVNLVHVSMSLVLSYKLIMKVGNSNAYMVIFFPIVLFLGAAVWIRRRRGASDVGKILAQGADWDKFMEEVDFFLSLLKNDENSAQNQGQLKNYLISAISQHHENCTMPHCELGTARTLQKLKNLNNRHIKIVSCKMLKKIEWLLGQYRLIDPQDKTLVFTLLKIYALYLPNRLRMHHLLNEAKGLELTWQHEYELYQYNINYELSRTAQNIDSLQGDEEFKQFENVLVRTVHCMAEFWSEFNDEKVDLNRIMLISGKLCPLKTKVEQMAEEQLKLQKFTAYKILRLYCQYLRTILEKQELAGKISEYLQVLMERLRDKQDLEYLAKESDDGLIIISLSESRLGNIFHVNEKACAIFKYHKDKLVGLKVNAIMPTVYGESHDQILTNFLKTKKQNYNTDQRMLFGKDGHGYLFPMLLQLKKASFIANDEYIFIASVKSEKTKEAPIYCIVSHDGLIQEFTASFRNMFLRKTSRIDFHKSIQEVIPDYFDEHYDMHSNQTRYFSRMVRNQLREREVTFVVLPILIRSIHEGFLIKVVDNTQKPDEYICRPDFTTALRNSINRKRACAHENIYQPNSNLFQIEGGKPKPIPSSNSNQHMKQSQKNERESAVMEDKPKLWGADIRTIRLIRNHYERIEEESSFYSEILNSEGKMDIGVKIEQMRLNLGKQKQKAVINSFKRVVLSILLLICAALFFIHSVYQQQIVEEREFLLTYDYQMQVKYYLSEYVIYFTLNSSGINPAYYSSKLMNLENTLINSVVNAQIDQLSKEEIMKITYLKSEITMQILLDTSNMEYNETDSWVASKLLLVWSIIIGLAFVLIILDVLLVYNLKAILFQIYSLFLAVKQASITKISDSCQAFLSAVTLEKEHGTQQPQTEKDQQVEEENSIEKGKKFKNASRRQDKVYLIELILPLLCLIAFCCLLMVEGNQSFSSYRTLKGYHNIMFECVPAISIEFMTVVVQTFKGINLTLNNQYAQHYQQLEDVIRRFDNFGQTHNYNNIMYGNVCQNSPIIPTAELNTCLTIANGVLTTGIASSLNFIASHLKNIHTLNAYNLAQLEVLIKLQFDFINPVLVDIENSMEDSMNGIMSPLYNNLSLFTILIALGYLLYLFYLVLHPIRNMELELDFTYGMINLIPDHKDQAIPPQQ